MQRERARQVALGHRQGLLRQRVHQVEVDVVEAGVLRQFHRCVGLAAVVDAAQALQAAVVETLDTDAQAIHARRAIALEAAVLGGAGVGLQGDLGPGCEAQPRARTLQEAVDAHRREQAGGAATEKYRVHRAAPDQRQIEVEVGQQRVHVSIERQRAAAFSRLELVRVEVAVRAFAHAPRQVDVQRQGRGDESHRLIVSPGTAASDTYRTNRRSASWARCF